MRNRHSTHGSHTQRTGTLRPHAFHAAGARVLRATMPHVAAAALAPLLVHEIDRLEEVEA